MSRCTPSSPSQGKSVLFRSPAMPIAIQAHHQSFLTRRLRVHVARSCWRQEQAEGVEDAGI